MLTFQHYHPEASAFKHNMIVSTRLEKTGIINLIFARFFHNFGKEPLKEISKETEYPTALGHAYFAESLVSKYKDRILSLAPNADVEKNSKNCRDHMKIKNRMKKKQIEKIKSKGHYKKLPVFTKADNMLSEFEYGN